MALFAEVQVSLFVAGAVFGEVEVSLFVAGAVFGEVWNDSRSANGAFHGRNGLGSVAHWN